MVTERFRHAHHRHRPRRPDVGAQILDLQDAVDRSAGARRGRIGAARAHRRPRGEALRARRRRDPSDRTGCPPAPSPRPERRRRQSRRRASRRRSARRACCAPRNRAAMRRPLLLSNSCWSPNPSVRIASFGMPALASCCCTPLIASAFARCASRGFLARDSTASVTYATSGTRRTIASPLVTIVGTAGGGTGSCARARGGQRPAHSDQHEQGATAGRRS